VQCFLEDLLDMLDNLGLEVPAQDQGQPPIIWHDPSTYFPGETLVRAMHAGANFFRAKPAIIFVLLPDIGESSLLPLYLEDTPATTIVSEVLCQDIACLTEFDDYMHACNM